MASMDNIATELQIFHQNILDIFSSKESDTSKWEKIAMYMDDNNPVVVKTFNTIKKK